MWLDVSAGAFPGVWAGLEVLTVLQICWRSLESSSQGAIVAGEKGGTLQNKPVGNEVVELLCSSGAKACSLTILVAVRGFYLLIKFLMNL